MKDAKTGQNRRDFLKLAGTAPAAAAALAVTADDAQAVQLEEGEGLRTTEHTKKYLETARF
jgi:hypothetical protein